MDDKGVFTPNANCFGKQMKNHLLALSATLVLSSCGKHIPYPKGTVVTHQVSLTEDEIKSELTKFANKNNLAPSNPDVVPNIDINYTHDYVDIYPNHVTLLWKTSKAKVPYLVTLSPLNVVSMVRSQLMDTGLLPKEVGEPWQSNTYTWQASNDNTPILNLYWDQVIPVSSGPIE